MATHSSRVLITGGAGYIGSTLTPLLLEHGYDVTVLDNLSFGQASLLQCCKYSTFHFIDGDVCNVELISNIAPKFEIVIPLAAIVGAPACAKNPELARSVNLDSYYHLVDSLSEDQIVLFPSTNSGYGIGEQDIYCTEKSPLNPISQYARDKVEIEKTLLATGNSISFRLATVFGMSSRMRLDLLVNDFVVRAIRDKFLVLYEQHFRRNFIHVNDVAHAFMFGIQNYQRMKGNPFNVGLSSANLTKRELAEAIKKHIPDLYIHAAEFAEDQDKRDYLVSNDLIESLGWQAKYSLDDGITELIKGYDMLKSGSFSNV